MLFGRQATATSGVAMCAPATRIHRVKWANPAVSGVQYDASTVVDAKPGDYLAFEWDDVVHDVWLVPNHVADPCAVVSNSTDRAIKVAHAATFNATELVAASHHATVDPSTEDTVVHGRNWYRIPPSAAGFKLLFVCSINSHCKPSTDGDGNTVSGQQLGVNVGVAPAAPDAKLTDPDGVCEEQFTLCPDQSKQTATSAEVETDVNVPWMDPMAADLLKLEGTASRAQTPWSTWKYRRVNAKRCVWRKQNPRISYRAHGSAAGVDHMNQPAWEFPSNTLRDVVEACSSSHPDTCVGIAWKAPTGMTFSTSGEAQGNHTLSNPQVRTHSSARRCCGRLGETGPGWMPQGTPVGQWMQMDLGADAEVNGVVTQARGNSGYGSMAVTRFKLQYATAASPTVLIDVGSFTGGPTNAEYAADIQHKTNFWLPGVITARYLRFTIEAHVDTNYAALRAGVMLHLEVPDPFVGKHSFRRCLATDRYTKLVTVAKLTWAESQALNQTTPQDMAKSVPCPGCYQCREVPIAPNTGSGSMYNPIYSTYRDGPTEGFNVKITDPGTDGAVLTISQAEPMKVGEWGMTWGQWAPEFMCRIDPKSSAGTLEDALEADLVDDAEWVTFLMPGMGTNQTDPTAPDTVIDAIQAGFQPPEMVLTLMSTDQNNLNAVYPPGTSVDPSVTNGPWYSREWRNLQTAANSFKLPAQSLSGARGGWWPPKPTLKVPISGIWVETRL